MNRQRPSSPGQRGCWGSARLPSHLLLGGVLLLLAADGVTAQAVGAAAIDLASFHASSPKVATAPTAGRTGDRGPGSDQKALRLTFAEGCEGAFASVRLRPDPTWDRAAGISFWVKGDGSKHLGGLELIWNDDYGQRYACSFSIEHTGWTRVSVPWRDFIPEVGPMVNQLDGRSGNPPSRLTQLSFGKWWYWRDYASHSYIVDDLQVETTLPVDRRTFRPAGEPLARVRAKLRAGRPITVVTMGDSLTDTAHWSNRTTNWPADFSVAIQQRSGSRVTLVNPAMGGTELRQNLVVMRRWVEESPAPDLVTIFFGPNDYTAGMRGPAYYEALKDAVNRVRRATGGRADVLIMTTRPDLNDANLDEMAAAGRRAAAAENAGLADVNHAFATVPAAGRQALYASDNVHLGRAGQELVAQTVVDAVSPASRR